MKLRSRVAGVALGIALIAAALSAPIAHAEPTRAEYIAQLEPICQANTEANRRILKGVRAKVKKGKYKKAARQFARAAVAFGATVEEIAATPQPSADATVLANWIGYLNLETAYLRGISKALKADKPGKAQGFAVRLSRNANLANDAVYGFAFEHCRLDPSDFT